MTHKDHVQLLQKGIGEGTGKVRKQQVWADFGSGEGAFTLALADVLGSTSTIYSIDKNESSLHTQNEAFTSYFPDHHVEYICQNFTKELSLPPLDGIVAANSLHFLKNKIPTLQLFRKYLKSDGRLVIIEYNVDTGNMWVPYPFSYETFCELAEQAGFNNAHFLSAIPSHFLQQIYSAIVYK